MITKEQFMHLINLNLEHWKRMGEIGDAIGTPVYDLDIVQYGEHLFDFIIDSNFENSAVDEIFTTLWNFHEDIDDKKYVIQEEIDDLWESVKTCMK